jgi:formylglycine-generating enzyme required for sulfatase activity
LALVAAFAAGCKDGEQREQDPPSKSKAISVAKDGGQKESVSAFQSKAISVALGVGVKMDFVAIPPGSFMMGDAVNGPHGPVHKVTLTKGFCLGKTEVTREQWQAVMGGNPSEFKGPKYPVETVSWNDCQDFLRKLNEKLPGQGFRLPTEAEWEYACRAGSTTAYAFGDGEANLGEYAWYAANSANNTHPVGEKKANAWDLLDMHGNVWEWCADWYGPYGAGDQKDPVGPPDGQDRVLRGGSWLDSPMFCRSANRHLFAPGSRFSCLGFRVARPLP